jgi:hypothetical protein
MPKNENVPSIEFGVKTLTYGNKELELPYTNATSVAATLLPMGDIYFDKIPWKEVLCEHNVDRVELS